VLRRLRRLSTLAILVIAAWGPLHHAAATRPPPLPEGRAIANLSSAACMRILRRHHVPFVPYARDAEGVRDPVLLEGPIGGIAVEHHGRRQVHAVLDCRLVVALLAWAPTLREAGITTLRHVSVYRAGSHVGGTSRPSGHAAGLAMDLRYVHFEDGTEVDVLTGWVERTRDAPPCDAYPDEPAPSSTLRAVVCRAVSLELFQTVVTPHHNDEHANHVHVEVVPDVDWSWVR